jgi:Fur family ferric uptake transcriptional regulator
MNFEQAVEKYKDFLDAHKQFYTRERARILEAVFAYQGHFSAEDLAFEMQKNGQPASRATLYRALAHLQDAGILTPVDLGHGHIHYEPPEGESPHEHISCVSCGHVFEAEMPELEKAIAREAKKQGFSAVHHSLRISGVCKNCRGL